MLHLSFSARHLSGGSLHAMNSGERVTTPVSQNSGYRLLQRGQAMTEYLIILALIAVAAIAVYQSFGQVIRSQTAGLARELAGESASQAVSAAKAASGEALKQKQSKTLKSYGTNTR